MRLKHACVDGGQYGVNVSPDEYQITGTRMIRTSDLAGRDLDSAGEGVFLGFTIPRTQILEKNDLLLSRAGTIGRSYLVPTDAAGMTFAGFLVRFRPASGFDARFLQYVIQSKLVQEQISSQAVTSTIQNFNADRYANLEIPDVEEDQQRRVADFLDDRVSRIDRMIRARQEQLTLLSEEFDSWWAAEFDRLADAFPMAPIRRVLESIVDGPFGSSLASQHYGDAGTRVIRLGNIGKAAFRNEDHAYIASEYGAELASHAAVPGDLVMAGLGDEKWPLGRCAVVPEIGPAIVKADCYRLRLVSTVSHHFAAIMLSSPSARSRFTLMARGATRARLNTAIAREALLPVAPMEVQMRAVQDWELRHADGEQLRAGMHNSIELLTEYKTSLITAAVTGELDVTTAGSNIPG